MVLAADAENLVVDLLRGCGASAGGVDVKDYGFDGRVFAEFAELGVDLLSIENDTVDVDDGDLAIVEAA